MTVQIWSKKRALLPRFARPRHSFWLQYLLNCGAKMWALLPRFARPTLLSLLQWPFKFGAKSERFCLASLGQGIYFDFNHRSNLDKKCERFCLGSLGQRFYFGVNDRPNFEQKASASASLRSANAFISASTSFNFGQKLRGLLPRFARPRRLFWLQYPLKIRIKKRFCLASLGGKAFFWLQCSFNF